VDSPFPPLPSGRLGQYSTSFFFNSFEVFLPFSSPLVDGPPFPLLFSFMVEPTATHQAANRVLFRHLTGEISPFFFPPTNGVVHTPSRFFVDLFLSGSVKDAASSFFF